MKIELRCTYRRKTPYGVQEIPAGKVIDVEQARARHLVRIGFAREAKAPSRAQTDEKE